MVDKAGILVGKAIVVLPPDVARQEIIERGDGPSPLNFIADLQPLRVLVEHGINDMDKRLVAGEEAVAASQQIAFEPSLALMLAQHLHHPSVGREMVVV